MKLTKTTIDRIINLYMQDASWTLISKAIGVHRNTLWLWRCEGAKDVASGLHAELDRRLCEAREVLYAKYHEVVRRAATQPRIYSTYRVLWNVKTGEVLSREWIIKTKPPDASIALRRLAVLCPESWAPSNGEGSVSLPHLPLLPLTRRK